METTFQRIGSKKYKFNTWGKWYLRKYEFEYIREDENVGAIGKLKSGKAPATRGTKKYYVCGRRSKKRNKNKQIPKSRDSGIILLNYENGDK